MSKIVIIDVDSDRSTYASLQIANSFRHLKTDIEITLITTSPDKFLESTDVFKDVVVIPGESRDFENLKKLLTIPASIHWDFLFNFSRDPSGVIISKFLKASEYHGAYLQDGNELLFSNFTSYLHFHQAPGEILPIHQFQLYKSMIDFKEPVKVFKFFRESDVMKPVLRKIDEMRMSTQRKKIVLIDADMGSSEDPEIIKFVSGIFLSVIKYTDFLPVLFSGDADEKTLLIEDIQKFSKEKVYLVSLKDSAKATFFSLSELVITDNPIHMNIADFVQRPSIFLGPSDDFSFSRSSACPGSLLILAPGLDVQALKRVQRAIPFLINHEKKNSQPAEVKLNAFQTLEVQATTYLDPVEWNSNEVPQDFWKWTFISRYLMGLSDPDFKGSVPESKQYADVLNLMKDLTLKAMNKFSTEKKSVTLEESQQIKADSDHQGVFGYILLLIHFLRGSEQLTGDKLPSDIKAGIENFNRFISSELLKIK